MRKEVTCSSFHCNTKIYACYAESEPFECCAIKKMIIYSELLPQCYMLLQYTLLNWLNLNTKVGAFTYARAKQK